MRHHARPIALIVLAAVAGAGLAWADDSLVSVTSVASIRLDGDPGDWKDVPIQTEEDRPWTSAVASDGQNLYVLLRFSDLDLANVVLRSGTLLWVNGDAKHETGFGLRYRGTQALQRRLRQIEKANAPAETLASRNAAPGRRNRNNVENARPPRGTLEVLRNAVVNEMINDAAQPEGLGAASQVIDDEYVFEFRIPLSELAAPDAGSAAAPERLAVGFQMTGLTPRERAELRARRGGRNVSSPWANAPLPGSAVPAGADAPPSAPSDAAAAVEPSSETGTSDGQATPRRPRRNRAPSDEATTDESAANGSGTGATQRRLRRWATVWLDLTLGGQQETIPAAER